MDWLLQNTSKAYWIFFIAAFLVAAIAESLQPLRVIDNAERRWLRHGVVFAIGAQGTKAIGVEGDSAKGVFHAKDVVYHFNRLPGFGDRPFDMGKHVAVIGAGELLSRKASRAMPFPFRISGIFPSLGLTCSPATLPGG